VESTVGALRSPIAMRLIALAAFKYASSRVGDSACASAMLSKLALLVSSGSQLPASTSSASRSCTAREYSGRFRRWKVRTPGLGFAAAAASTSDSSVEINVAYVAASGRGASGGGMKPACSFRMTFSAISGFCAACETSNAASDNPPALPLSLWQPAQ
jgi:hypothetical protein